MFASSAAVLITADSVRDYVHHRIRDELVSGHSLELIFETYCHVTESQVREIYPRLVAKPFFPAIVHNLTFGPCLLVIYRGEDIYATLKAARGCFRLENGVIHKSGLRLRYQGKSKEELIAAGYYGQELFFRSFEFRIHGCDNLEETKSLCQLLLTADDLALIEHELGEELMKIT